MPKIVLINVSELAGDGIEVFRHDDTGLERPPLKPGEQIEVEIGDGEEIDVRVAGVGPGGGRRWDWDVSAKRVQRRKRGAAAEEEDSGETAETPDDG